MARFLFISTAEGLAWGGSEVLWLKVAHELLAMGHHVAYSYAHFAEEPEPLRELRTAGAIDYYRGDPADALWLRRLRRVVRRQKARANFPAFSEPHWLLSLVMEEKPDLVVLNCCDAYQVWPLASAFEAIHRQGITYAVICQLEDESVILGNQKREALVSLYAEAREVSFGSRRGADLLARQLASKLHASVVFDNPVHAMAGPVAWPESSYCVRFSCVGRLDVCAKGQDVILAALGQEHWQARNWRMTFYGRGWQENYLRQLAQHYGIHDRVDFAGFVPDLKTIWAPEHLCLQPSPKEGTPMTVVEAMFAGRPCLVTDIGRMPDLVEEGKTGWICSRGVASLSAALERAWAQRGEWEAMGKAGHDKVRQVWRKGYPRQMAERFLGLVGESV